jgi:hypothetical protein
MTIENCGVSDHNPECLCDVIITHATPWIGDAVQDMWMGQEIVKLMDYRQPWDDSDILEYLGNLVEAKDNWSRVDLGAFNNVDGEHEGRSPRWMDTVRAEIKRRLRSMRNPSIAYVIKELGLTQQDIDLVFFTNKKSMTIEQLEEFEEAVLTSRYHSHNELGNAFGMACKSAKKLHDFWGTPFAGRVRRPELAMMDELFVSNPELSNREIAIMITTELGIHPRVDPKNVYSRRVYLRKRGRLN